MSAESCLTCKASLMCIYISVALMYIYMLDSWSLCFLGCFVLWSLGGFCCNARWNQITVKCCIKEYDITDGISTFTFLSAFQTDTECCIYSTGFYVHFAAYYIDNTRCATKEFFQCWLICRQFFSINWLVLSSNIPETKFTIIAIKEILLSFVENYSHQ